MRATLSRAWSWLGNLMATPIGLILLVIYVAGVSYVLANNPLSLLWRLALLVGILLVYYIRQPFWIKGIVGGVIMLIIIPIIGFSNPFLFELAFQIAVFATLALGLNIVVGFAGLLDLGYIAFFAVGAYLWAFFGSHQIWNLWLAPGTVTNYTSFPFPNYWFWGFLILGVLAAGGTGILLGMPVLRLRGDYLAIVTLGFGEVIRVLANNLSKPINLTNGPQGITRIQRPFEVTPEMLSTVNGWFGINATAGQIYSLFFYLMALAVLIFSAFLAFRLEASKLGRSWTAIREDDVAAVAMGVPLRRTKLTAFAIGAAFSGGMGVIYAAHRTFVSPETFALTESISVLVMVILGGLGSIPGVILGAAIVTVLEIDLLQTLSLQLSSLRQGAGTMPLLGIPWRELPTQLDPARYQRLVFGILLVVMMIFRPEGIIPSQRARLELHEDEENPLDPTNPSATLEDRALEQGGAELSVLDPEGGA